MTYREYCKLRRQTQARVQEARNNGWRALRTGDWRELVAACKENDAAYLADCAAQSMLDRVTDLHRGTRE
jgi:hypothetical protein